MSNVNVLDLEVQVSDYNRAFTKRKSSVELVVSGLDYAEKNKIMFEKENANIIIGRVKEEWAKDNPKTDEEYLVHYNKIEKMVLDEVDEINSAWVNVANVILAGRELITCHINRVKELGHVSTYYEALEAMTEKEIFDEEVFNSYTKEELESLEAHLSYDKADKIMTHAGRTLMIERYNIRAKNGKMVESTQERFMNISLTVGMNLIETSNITRKERLERVVQYYWAISSLYITVATPIMSNAGKPKRQLSSCFIDTTEDSLNGIYNSNTDIANLSKFGGGIGVYMGKVRGQSSSIQGVEGVSSGVLPWIKQLNNTAVSVDQLGMRQGAIAVYLDVFHTDIEMFLDLKLNNGDERLRAHDIFHGICLPDIFMERLVARKEWYLFDPHEVRTLKGWSLEDFYDEKKGSGSFRDKYMECVNTPELSRKKIEAIDLMKRVMRSQMETGSPFMFYRDEVNRKNPNKHKGMIYSSNLCSEIAQNMSPTEFIEEKMVTLDNGDKVIATYRKSGDFVVCNLASLNLGRVVKADLLEEVVPLVVEILDNTIEINKLPIEAVKETNSRYRGIGLGTFGWHQLLAQQGIYWESEESVTYCDNLYEKIAYLTIKASSDLSDERGAYPLFEGSDWETGQYFIDRDYFPEDAHTKLDELTEDELKWLDLSVKVKESGLRNGYLMAVAPNTSTSVIAGSTASIDPVFKVAFSEEKKNVNLFQVAPGLNAETYEFYKKGAHALDQRWSIKQNIARQRHIDQSISFNTYFPNTIHAKVLLELMVQAWEGGMKTSYYSRSTSSDIEECEWCH